MKLFCPLLFFVSLLVHLLLHSPAVSSAYADHGERPPNIVLIFADDLGWKDVGYQGTDFYETPNIDRLASEGIVFSAAYSSAGNCQPSRACLISGQYTPRHHVYAVQGTERGPKQLMRTLPIPNRSGLAANEISLADALRSGGYATGIFGKWHLGGPDGCTPGQQGFDVVMDVDHSGRGVSDDPKGIYAITRAAGEFMESNRDKPFFAYVSHHAIHTALQFHQATLDRFKNKSLSQEQSGGGYDAANQRSAVTGNDNHNNGPQHTNRQYAACTFDFDNAVGLLLKQIDELGLRENTLVIFTSDNGATPQSSQEPLRGNKGSYHEGGIREPFIARWPGRIAPGSKCDTPIINIDLFPTFLDAGGIAVPAGKVLDGESLVGLMTHGDTLKRKSIFWHFPGYLDRPVPRGRDPIFRTRPVSVINRDHWKLYLYHEEWSLDGGREGIDSNGAVELYNLRDDIGERIDLAGTNIAKRDELLDELLKWFESAGAKLASEPNPNFDPNFQSRKDRPGEEPAAKANAINAATKTAPDSG